MKRYFMLLLIAFSIVNVYADGRGTIASLLDKNIIIADGFAGQSITLVKDASTFFIIRDFFGSGVPIVASIKYSVVFDSDYQIRFFSPLEVKGKTPGDLKQENFTLTILDNGKVRLLLNGVQVVIAE